MSQPVSALLETKPSGDYVSLPHNDLKLSVELQKEMLSNFIEDVKEITLRYLYLQDEVTVDMLTDSEKPTPFNDSVYQALKPFGSLVTLHTKGYNSFEALDVGLQTYEGFSDDEKLEYYHSEEAVDYLFNTLLFVKYGLDGVDKLIRSGHLIPYTPATSSSEFYSQTVSEYFAHADYSKLERFASVVFPLINYGERDFSEIEKDLREFHLNHKYKVN